MPRSISTPEKPKNSLGLATNVCTFATSPRLLGLVLAAGVIS